MKRRVLLLLAALTAPWALHAQPASSHEAHFEPIAGYHFGKPAKISVVVGIGRAYPREVGRWKDSIWISSWRRTNHVFLLTEPGIKGARLSAGYGVERGSHSSLTLVSARLSAYRRWGSDHADPGGTFLGI